MISHEILYFIECHDFTQNINYNLIGSRKFSPNFKLKAVITISTYETLRDTFTEKSKSKKEQKISHIKTLEIFFLGNFFQPLVDEEDFPFDVDSENWTYHTTSSVETPRRKAWLVSVAGRGDAAGLE